MAVLSVDFIQILPALKALPTGFEFGQKKNPLCNVGAELMEVKSILGCLDKDNT